MLQTAGGGGRRLIWAPFIPPEEQPSWLSAAFSVHANDSCEFGHFAIVATVTLSIACSVITKDESKKQRAVSTNCSWSHDAMKWALLFAKVDQPLSDTLLGSVRTSQRTKLAPRGCWLQNHSSPRLKDSGEMTVLWLERPDMTGVGHEMSAKC